MDQKNQGTVLLLKADGNYTRKRIRRLRVDNNDGTIEDHQLFLGSVLIEEGTDDVTLSINAAPEKTESQKRDTRVIHLPVDSRKFDPTFLLYVGGLAVLYLLHRLLVQHGY
jgi:hypothetical protein